MKNGVAFSILFPCVALTLGALSACSSGSPGFSTSDAGTSETSASTGSSVGESGHNPGSGTGSSAMGGSSTGSSVGSTDAGASQPSQGSGSGSSSTSSGNSGDPEPPDMVGMTAAHNAARAAVQPAASPPLPPMAWSSTVAASAQAFTTNCVFADTMNSYGSNAFAGTGTYTPAQVVASWVGEDANYDYASNSCAAGKECGHYTQVVWRDSVGLGCGMTNCTVNNPLSGDGSGAWQLWVCNYDPAGNYVGEQPY